MQCEHSSGNGLILHTGAIGDCLLALPLADSLKTACGLHRLDFIGPSEYIEFYPGRTCIDTVRSIESLHLHQLFEPPPDFESSDHDKLAERFKRYEQVVSFLGYDNAAFERNLLFTVHSTHSAEVTLIPAKPPSDMDMHVTDFYLDIFRRDQQIEHPLVPPLTTITPLPDDYLAGTDILEQAGVDSNKPVVIIHPGSGSREKCWHWENFVQVAHNLQSRSVQPVFLLGPVEQERFEDPVKEAIGLFHVLENFSLTQIVQVMTQAEAFLGNDSGVAHLAAGMGTQTLALFATSDPTQYAPRGPKAVIEQIPDEQFHKSIPEKQTVIFNRLLEML